MADIRIKDLATTAASTASDDFVAVDGSANGTRKLNAYSPTFGGNLTVSGTGNSSIAGNLGIGETSPVVPLHVKTTGTGTGDFDNAIATFRSTAAGRTITLQFSDTTNQAYISSKSGALNFGVGGATLGMSLSSAGNLTVSGTGTSSVAGNFGIGTTSPEGRLHLAASASGATGSILVLDNPIASALNNSNQIAFLNDVGASYAGIANVRLKSLTTNAGNGSSAFTITTFDGSSEAERVRVFANGNFGIGTGSTDGGQKLQVSGTANIGNPFSTSTDDSLILHGKAVSDGSGNYGDYGSIVLSSSSSFTASARRYLITNAYLATDFAIIRSTNATTTPTIGTNGVVSSGTVDFRISESGNATFGGDVVLGAGKRVAYSASAYMTPENNVDGAEIASPGQFTVKTASTQALKIDSSQNATFAGNIKTAAPSGGTAATWRLGTVASVSPTSPNRTIEVEIGGTTYYIHAKTTND